MDPVAGQTAGALSEREGAVCSPARGKGSFASARIEGNGVVYGLGGIRFKALALASASRSMNSRWDRGKKPHHAE